MAPALEPGLGPDFIYQQDHVLVSPDVEPGHVLSDRAGLPLSVVVSAYA
jgi:hypothetical protein